MFGLIQEPPARRSRSLTISNDQGSIELPHHRNRYTPQPPTTARGTYPQKFNSPHAPHFFGGGRNLSIPGGRYTRVKSRFLRKRPKGPLATGWCFPTTITACRHRSFRAAHRICSLRLNTLTIGDSVMAAGIGFSGRMPRGTASVRVGWNALPASALSSMSAGICERNDRRCQKTRRLRSCGRKR